MNDLNHIYKVGNLICKLREEKGLSQQKLGELLGVTNKAVSRWENGRGYPDTSILLNLATILGITVDELLKGELFETRNKAKIINNNVRYNADKKLLITYSLQLIPYVLAIIWIYLSLKYTHEIYDYKYFNYFWTMFCGIIIPLLMCSISQLIIGLFITIKIHKRKDISIITKLLIALAAFLGVGLPYFVIYIYLIIRLMNDKK